jgi:hypothetical protein
MAAFSIARRRRRAPAARVCCGPAPTRRIVPTTSRTRRRPSPRSRIARSGPLAAIVCCLAACSTAPAVSARLGYASVAIGGKLALADGAAVANEQDIETAFGLGSERGSGYVQVAADFGVPELAASGFWLHDRGAGVLTESFGGLAAGTTVTSDLDLGIAKLTGAFGIPIGPVTIAPGALLDVIAIDFRASATPSDREEVDEIVAVPMPFVRVHVPWGRWQASADLAWIDAALLGADGRFADLEGTIAYEVAPRIDLFGGYRFVSADAAGSSSTDAVGIDLDLRGWIAGLGIRF